MDFETNLDAHVRQIIREELGKQVPVSPAGNGFGKKSKYYGLNIDGYVWDPYIDARFLPSKYLSWMESYGGDTSRAIRNEVSYSRAVEFTAETVKKLCLLKKKDPDAYRIEQMFFPLGICKQIFADYATKVMVDYLSLRGNRLAEHCKLGESVYLKINGKSMRLGECYEKVDFQAEPPRKQRYLRWSDDMKAIHQASEHLVEDVQEAQTYEELNKVITKCHLIRIPRRDEPKLPAAFVHAFKKRGAWKTVAYLVRFESYRIPDRDFHMLSGREAYEYLIDNLGQPDYVIHKILKLALSIQQA